jgi:hypothetical protein
MSLPAAFVHNLLLPLYNLTKIAIVISRSKYKRKKAENKIIDKIIESLLLSLEIVIKIIARLGLKTHKDIEQQIRNRGGYIYLTLTRLLEAYRLRFTPSRTVYLRSQKRLPKEYYSNITRLYFK